MSTSEERAEAAEDGLFRVVQVLGFDMDGARNAAEFFGPQTYYTAAGERLTCAPDIAVAYAASYRRDFEEEAEKYEAEIARLHAVMGRGFVETLKDRDEAYAEIARLRKRADEAWSIIEADYWRNRYDEDMARGNDYVALLRDRLRAALRALRK